MFKLNAGLEKKQVFLLICILYTALPMILFLSGFVSVFYALPSALLILYTIFLFIKNSEQFNLNLNWLTSTSVKYYFFTAALLGVWLYYSGIGAFSFQNADHHWRNTIFTVLVEYDWPVTAVLQSTSDRVLLCYYLGFFLPAALVGKLFGMATGFVFLYLWALLGLCILYALICSFLQRFSLAALLFFIFFSGLDALFYPADLFSTDQLEWRDICFQYSGFTSDLYWAYNQALPAWIMTALLVQCRNFRAYFFIAALNIILCPLPLAGLFLITALSFTFAFFRSDSKLLFIKHNLLCIEHLLTLLWIFIPLCYLTSNTAGNLLNFFNVLQNRQLFSLYLMFICLEVLIFLPLTMRDLKTEPLLWSAVIVLLVCPCFRVGVNFDFCMRASIPGLFLLYLYLCRNLYLADRQLLITYGFIFAFCIISPLHEILRSVLNTYEFGSHIVYKVSDQTLFSQPNFQSRLTDNNRFLIFMR